MSGGGGGPVTGPTRRHRSQETGTPATDGGQPHLVHEATVPKGPECIDDYVYIINETSISGLHLLRRDANFYLPDQTGARGALIGHATHVRFGTVQRRVSATAARICDGTPGCLPVPGARVYRGRQGGPRAASSFRSRLCLLELASACELKFVCESKYGK